MALMKISVTQFDKPFAIAGRFFKVVSAAQSVRVRLVHGDDSETETELYQGLAIDSDRSFKSFYISSDLTQEVMVFVSSAKLIDDRLEMSIQGAAQIENGAVSLDAGVVKQVLGSRLGRRSVLIVAEQDLYLGGANLTAANGVPVEAGQSITIDTTAALYALSTAGGSLRFMEEVN